MSLEETKIKKKILVPGLMVLVVGIVLAAVSADEPVTSLNDLPDAAWTPILSQDPANPSMLSPTSQPYSRTLWAYGPMPTGGSFRLNIRTSGPVRVTMASVASQQGLNVVFDEVGTSFLESVYASGGTFQLQIENEGTNPVQILEGSSVIGQQRVISYQTVYPYVAWGSLTAAFGVLLIVVGYFAKSKKRVPKK